MSNFNLNDAPEKTNNTNYEKKAYQQPGIYDNVKITEVVLGKSSLRSIPYMQLKTVGPNGELGRSNNMWLSTTVGKNLDGSPKKTSGWGVTARNLIEMIVATHNISHEEARAIQLVPDNENNTEKLHALLVNKVSALLIGKPFRGKFKGEQGKPREDGTPGLIYTTLDLVESMNIPASESKLRFDPAKDIKMYEGVETIQGNETEAETEKSPF